ncbi:hypothetical protein [Streptomyces sp. NPDC093109]|uniref:hypothetical protein n=1 Tax=Streptomyces sp. NPDC093109 TaxID=3154977 RepID=UPI00344E9339
MAEVEFSYDPPEISEEGDTVTWTWRVVNNLPEAAEKVVLKHVIRPEIPITSVTGPSEIVGQGVRSQWETLAAGETAEGQIIAKLPEDVSGSMQISGRVTWKKS